MLTDNVKTNKYMELQDLEIGTFKIETLDLESYVGNIGVKFKITNLSGEDQKVYLKDTRFNSTLKGIVGIGSPDIHLDFQYFTISAYSFVTELIYFRDVDKVVEGDVIELVINNCWEIKLRYTKLDAAYKWLVMESVNNNPMELRHNSDVEKNLIDSIEHFEAMEEKLGVTLQNFSVCVIGKSHLDLFYEMLITGEGVSARCFALQVVIYDKLGKIRYTTEENVFSDSFLGFKVMSHPDICLDMPLTDIGKIRIVPDIR